MADRATPAQLADMPHILLVEDNPLHVRLVSSMLAEVWPGFEQLNQVRRLDRALEYLERDRPDCVLLDLVLPDADGLESVKAILAAAPDLPVVVLSSHDDEQIALQALSEGAQDYLVKGTVEPQALLRAIRFAMNRRRIPELRHAPVVDVMPAELLEDESSAGIAVINRAGTLVYAETAVAEMLGRTIDNLVGIPPDDVYHSDDVARIQEAMDGAADTSHEALAISARFRHAAGFDLAADVVLRPLFGTSGEAEMFLASLSPHLEEGTLSSSGTYVVMSGWNG